MWSKSREFVANSPFRYWFIAFILLNLIVRGIGGTNQMSRFATMRAMSEQLTFKINDYKNLTQDLAVTKDGDYYSNKAPLPMIIGFPVFFALEKITLLKEKKKILPGKRKHPGASYSIILSNLLQVIPFAFLVLFVAHYLLGLGISISSINFFVLASFFGNTSSIFMNSYFGHGMTAMFILGLSLSILKKEYLSAGLFYGLALCSEYASVVLLPVTILAIVLQNKGNLSWIKRGLLGAIVPALIWCFYHIASFGSPFQTAIQNQIKDFQDLAQVKGNMFGLFAPIPNGDALVGLLFGPERGLLFTQPWMLLIFLILPILFFNKNLPLNLRPYAVFCFFGLCIMIWMNASFGQWHAGATAGPRYISIFMPALCLLAPFVLEISSKWMKNILWGLLFLTIVFRGLIYSTTILQDFEPLWTAMIKQIFIEGSSKQIIRLFIFFIIIIFTWFYSKNKQQVIE